MIAAILTVFLSGCGSAVRNSQGGMVRQTVAIVDSNGEALADTNIYVDGKLVGKTDTYGQLKHELPGPVKGDSFQLKVQKAGYRSVEEKVNAKIDGGFVTGDVFIGFLGLFPIIISMAVDGASDSWMAYPRYKEIVLDKGNSGKTKDAASGNTGNSKKNKSNGSGSKSNGSKSHKK